jgi:hypothetical protein
VFGPLKTAYRDQVERLYRGGANTIGKQHFTSLYHKARDAALTPRNIRAGWSKAGLFPFNPSRVLSELQRLPSELCTTVTINARNSVVSSNDPSTSELTLRTPTTLHDFQHVQTRLQSKLDACDEEARLFLAKISNAAEKVYADRAMLFDDNRLLFEQNNEKRTRESVRRTMVGRAKIMSYGDILEAERRRSVKDAKKIVGDDIIVTETPCVPVARMLSSAEEEALDARRELAAMGLRDYCLVLNFEGES